jgi:replication factor C subunit 1
MVELGVGNMSEDNAKMESQTKATFTRLYNSQSHPVPFMKASSVVAPKAAQKVQPDLEEAVDESGGEEVLPEGETKEDEEEDVDIKKDKYIKEPKKKAAPKKAAAKGKKRAKKEVDDDGEGLGASESEEQPKKPKKPAAKGGRKGKGKA